MISSFVAVEQSAAVISRPYTIELNSFYPPLVAVEQSAAVISRLRIPTSSPAITL